MSDFHGGPPQGNVVPFQGAGTPPPGSPPGPPPPQPNPAYQQWLQAKQQRDAVVAENQRRQQAFDAAVMLIKQDGLHGFRLDVEADSTVAPDEQQEQASRVEFLQQMVPLLENVVPIAQGNPPLASLAKEMVLFAARGFKVARPLEEALENAFDAIAQMPPHPQQQKGGTQQNPQVELAKTQADVHATQMKTQADVQDTNVKAQTDQMAIAQKQQQAYLQAQAAQQRTEAERERSQAQMAMQAAELQQKERLEAAKLTHMAARDAAGGLV